MKAHVGNCGSCFMELKKIVILRRHRGTKKKNESHDDTKQIFLSESFKNSSKKQKKKAFRVRRCHPSTARFKGTHSMPDAAGRCRTLQFNARRA